MANTYFVDQDFLTIKLTTDQDITGYSQILIKYRKPSGTEGSFTASVEDLTTGEISYEFTSGDLDEAGVWRFWAWVEFSGGATAAGESIKVQVCNEGRDLGTAIN